MGLLEKYPQRAGGMLLNSPEARLVFQYRKAGTEYNQMIGQTSAFLVPTLIDNVLVPKYDDSLIPEIQAVYEKAMELKKKELDLLGRINTLEQDFPDTDIGTLNDRKKNLESKMAKIMLVPAALKLKQAEYVQIMDSIEKYLKILGEI